MAMGSPFALAAAPLADREVVELDPGLGVYDEEQQLWVGEERAEEICWCTNSNFNLYNCFDVFFGDFC